MVTPALNPQQETGPGRCRSDGQLLEGFVKNHDEAAFAELLTRHGPYIFGVCRRVMAHAQDAEDVFQASFLELARRASSILHRDSVAGWLQTVALRLARRARARRGRQSLNEAAHARSEAIVDEANLSWREVRQALDEEMARLPDDLQSAVIVCLFEGHTLEEAGHILNVNPRTLKDRVRRGRERLRSRLLRRGITLAVLGTLLAGGEAEAAVPAALWTTTLKGASALVNKTSLVGTVSPSVLTLATAKGGLASGILLALFVVVSIVGYVGWGPLRSPSYSSVAESFRGGRLNRELLKWSGPRPERFVRFEPEGLRISLPAANGPAQPLGVALRPIVRGDFELEATFELLQVVRPNEGPGVGLTVYFFMDDEEWNGLWFGKMQDKVRGPVFLVGHRTGDRSQGEERVDQFTDTLVARKEAGVFRLRVERRGSVFRCFAAEGESGAFRLMRTLDASDKDVRIVRFAADPGWLPNALVDGRLVEFTLKAEQLVEPQADP